MSSAGGARDGSPFSLFSSGAAGALSLGSASPASAAFTLCKGSVSPVSKGSPGPSAKLSFSCNQEIRGYGIVSNKTLADYTDVPLVAGNPSLYVNCEGGVPASGFGCGVKNRNTPNNCGQSTTVLPAVTERPARGQPDHGTAVHPEDPARTTSSARPSRLRATPASTSRSTR